MFKFNKKCEEPKNEPGEVAYKCKYCGEIFYKQCSDVKSARRDIIHECGASYNNFMGIAEAIGAKKFTGNKNNGE